MADVDTSFREGDIFRWTYRDPNAADRPYGSYHCCSNIAVFHKGRLRDTYWQIGTSFSNGRSFGLDDVPKLNLTFIANFDDLEKVREYQGDYYDDDDIVNLNHANSSRDNFYLRKGAQRSHKKMLEVANYKLEQAQSKKRMAEWDAERLLEAIAKIEAGDTSVQL